MIDIFGKSFSIKFNQKHSYKSSFGGILSIFCLGIIVYTGYLLSIKIFDKKNPTMISKIIPFPNSVNLTFLMNTAYLIEDQNGVYQPDALDYLEIKAFVYKTYVLVNEDGTKYSKKDILSLSNRIC